MKLRGLILIGSFIIGLGLMIVSFFLPPQGVIDPSVLNAVGMIFTFSAVIEGLLSNKIIKLTHKNTEIYIGDKQ
jgi:hypothetical protein